MRRVFTICPHCGCGCGLYLLVEGDEVVGVMPSAGHPISQGSLCMKGWTSFQHLRRPERLDAPRVRRNGKLEAAPWEEALARVVEGLEDVWRKRGGQSIGLWASGRTTNEELLLLRRLARQGLETEAIRFGSLPGSLEHIPPCLVGGPGAARFDEIQAADLLVMFGQGLEEHHPQVASRILKAMDHGSRGAVVSPRRDLLAGRATIYLQVSCLEEVAAALARGGGGPVEPLRRMWGEVERPLMVYPLGSLAPLREAALLRALEDLLAKDGAKVLLLFPQANSRGAFHRKTRVAEPVPPGLKALLIVEEDPAAWDESFRELSAGLDLLVVQDLFLTETAGLAHVVLPSAGFAEKGGTFTNTEGREQELQPAVLPFGEARPGWTILAELSRRLGLPGVGSTLEEIRRGTAAEQVEAIPAGPPGEAAWRAAADPPGLQHVPDRLGWMWLRDTVLRHTDDWQREHQDRWVEVHPEDAKALGLRPGWTVRVAGEGGEFRATVRASERVGRGVLFSPHDLLEGPVQVERAA